VDAIFVLGLILGIVRLGLKQMTQAGRTLSAAWSNSG
jgi:hypothetical protein